MQLLLDTHAFIWLAEGNPRLSKTAQATISDPRYQPCLSIASGWEMAIKVGLKRLRLKAPLGEFLGRAESQNIVLVPISIAMLSVVESLPLHHRDPFDRLLAATCLAEQMTLVSADAVFDEYGVRRIW